jgi:heat shock protein 4
LVADLFAHLPPLPLSRRFAQVVSAQQALATLLTHLLDIGRKDLKSPKMVDCVVGVPSYFNDRQRVAMLEACKISGVHCLSLLNETAAVALGYGIYRSPQLPTAEEVSSGEKKARRVVFVDVGHSQIQMSCCDIIKGKLTVLATAAERVGGRDFDRVLYEHFADEFKKTYKIDVRSNPRAQIRLEEGCEKLKKLMSSNEKARLPINIECLMDDKDVSSGMVAPDFEVLSATLLERIDATCTRLIDAMSVKGKKFNLDDIDFVETVGGASRTPMIRRIIQSRFGKELSATLNMDEAVARGCALWACMKSPTLQVREFVIVDATTYGIDLVWEQGELDDAVSVIHQLLDHGRSLLGSPCVHWDDQLMACHILFLRKPAPANACFRPTRTQTSPSCSPFIAQRTLS